MTGAPRNGMTCTSAIRGDITPNLDPELCLGNNDKVHLTCRMVQSVEKTRVQCGETVP